MVHTLRLKSRGNRLGPGLISQLNRYTNNTSKTLEELNKLAAKGKTKKVLIAIAPGPSDQPILTLLYPGDAQILRHLTTPNLEQLNQARLQYGLKPIHGSTMQGILRTL